MMRSTNCLAATFVAAVCFTVSVRAASPVADAAQQGNREAVRTLIKQAADVNAAQGDGMTALHWAARNGDAELTQMLLYAGANVRATTRLGSYTPLLMASEQGHAGVVGALLRGGADPKAATSAGTTPLMLASAAGKVDAVKALLDAGADANAKESVRGQTALMFASAYDRRDAMKLLIARGADLEAATKVVDLRAQTNPEEEAFLAAQRGGGGPSTGSGQAAGSGQGGRGQRAAAPAEPAAARGGRGGGGGGRGGRGGAPEGNEPGLTRQFRFAELVSTQGGITPLLFAARQGHAEAATLLLDAGADLHQAAGDHTTPLLMAIINGHFDLAKTLLDRGADPRKASDNGVTPLYAVLNCQWAPKALYPQPRAYMQQKLTYLDLMTALVEKGADVNARLKMKVWYSGYNFDLSGVDEVGATPFWRAAYASDVDAMRLLVAAGADPFIPTSKPAGRPRTGDAGGRETIDDLSGKPPVPTGGPGVPPLQAATGVGYGEGYAANSHRNAPSGWLPAVKYLVEEIGVDVNERDHEGNTALHHAAARGDNEVILYLVSKGADPKAVNRAGETTVDMANGPVQRTQPYPETIALLEKMGAKNNHRCKSC
jgi:ankyrin repeat protein